MLTVLVLAFACVTGCGGSGGGGNGAGSTNNTYVGNYFGEFQDASNVIAPFSMSVALNGTVRGTFVYSGGVVSFTGKLKNKGVGTITTANGTSNISLGLPYETTLSGSVANTNGNGAYFTAITNPSGVFGGTNPFKGDFAGSVSDTTIGTSTIIAIVIDASGNITGSHLVSTNGTLTLSAITGTITSAGALSYTIIATNALVTGNVTLSNGAISGSLVNGQNNDALTLSMSAVQ